MNAKTIRPVRFDGPGCYITLTRGLEAVVDETDAALVGQYNWCAHPAVGGLVYARTEWRADGKRTRVTMHRLLIAPDPGYVVDHIDGNGLNNRRLNLRVCLHKENLRNSASRKQNGLPKGVNPCRHRFEARIQVDGVVHRLGTFDTPEEAAAVYREAAERLHGMFARY